MILRRFEWAHDDWKCSTGWRMVGSPDTFDVGPGLQVAHDCFEHLNYDGSIESELMAFGAMIYIRSGGYNYWHAKGAKAVMPTAEIMADDLARFLAERQLDVKHINTKPLDDEEDERIIKDVPKYVIRLLRDELGMKAEEHTYVTIRAALRNAQHWMRRGYRLSKRRWKQHRDTLCELFIAVESDTDMLSRHCDVGDQLEVRLHFDNARHDVTISRGH